MSDLSHSEVKALAHTEMSKWGLIDNGWKFKINATTRRHGQCCYKSKTIELSSYRIEHDPENKVMQTILHEIAHALHYQRYVDSNRKREFFARERRGRRFCRVIKPHGAEWRRIAWEVGVNNPRASSKGNASKHIDWKWHLVTVINGVLHDENNGYMRFPKRVSSRYFTGRKRETIGRIFLVAGDQWRAFTEGRIGENELRFFQDSNVVPASRGIQNIV